jgi:hypothetical protein
MGKQKDSTKFYPQFFQPTKHPLLRLTPHLPPFFNNFVTIL